jgi:hypothetical protein
MDLPSAPAAHPQEAGDPIAEIRYFDVSSSTVITVAFLMRVCELVRASQLPDLSGERPSRFRDVMDNDDYMAAVFEAFIRNFYSLKHSPSSL